MKSNKSEAVKVEVKVTRAHKVSDTLVLFDIIANGVSISGMKYIEYTTKEGKDGDMISFPSYEDKKEKGKYWNHCWFPISNDLKNNIVDQLEKLI